MQMIHKSIRQTCADLTVLQYFCNRTTRTETTNPNEKKKVTRDGLVAPAPLPSALKYFGGEIVLYNDVTRMQSRSTIQKAKKLAVSNTW